MGHQFLPVKRRTPRLRPTLHRFYCLQCGQPIEEWSDEKHSAHLCAGCIRVNAYIQHIEAREPVQVELPRDWWANWCIWYEAHRSEFWKDVPQALAFLQEDKCRN